MRPDEVDEVDLGGEDVGDDDRGKNLIAKRLRDLGLLELLSVLWAVLAVLATRLERRFLLRGLKMELERLEGGRPELRLLTKKQMKKFDIVEVGTVPVWRTLTSQTVLEMDSSIE